MTCPRCQATCRDGVRFCESCGISLAETCPRCRAAVTPGASFCGTCGVSLAATQPDRFASPGSYTPAHLAKSILTSRSALEGERKQVTVLFCDLANSTPLAELLGPESMYGLLNGFFELALGEVHRYEGTINQFLGDGFMALFGAPLYCQRALEYGLAVDDLRLKVSALVRMGSTHVQRGDTAACLERCAEAQALSPTPYDAAAVRAIRAYGLVKEGRLAEGVSELEAALAWYARSQLRFTRSQFSLWLADAYLRQGASARARRVAEEVLATSQEVGYGHLEGVAHRMVGECLVTADPVTAESHLDLAVGILERVGAQNEIAKSWVTQAAIHTARGEAPVARALLERALALFEELRTLDEPTRIRERAAVLTTPHSG